MFSHLPPYAGDPILSLMEQFQRDERSNKVNLSIGIYTDGRGVVPVLPSVRTASAAVAETGAPYVYLPMEGHAAYRQAVAKLLFGADLPSAEHLAIVQTLGGSGALKVGADLIARFFPQPTIWLPDPTWDNHVGIFEGAGFKTERYPYYDAQTKGLNFNGMLDKLQSLPKGAVVLLHPCCHNPTGVDPTRAQWEQLIAVVEQRGLLPFFDLAYQGFAESLEDDIWPVREAVRRQIPFFLSNSFSKIFSLYSERIGALSVFCPQAGQAKGPDKQHMIGKYRQQCRRSAQKHGEHIQRDRAQDAEAVPAVRDPDRSIVYASPRMGSEQDRFQVWRLETACKAEGVVRHAVTYSIEVAADQPNPLRHIE